MLSNASPTLCSFALSQVPRIRDKKLALPKVLAFAVNSEDRPTAIRMVPSLVDEVTKEASQKIIEAMRYDNSPAVREAATEALKMFD